MKKLITLLVIVQFALACNAQQVVTQQEGKPLTAEMKAEVIEGVGQAMIDGYVFPDKGEQVAKDLKERLTSKAYDEINDFKSLVDQLTKDIQATINDVHFNLFYFPPSRGYSWVDPGDSEETKEEAENEYRTFSQKQNHGLKKLQVLDGNIGYMEMASFNSPVRFVEETVASAMQFLENTEAIIVDVRNNGGGQPEYVNLLQSYFFPEKTLLNMKYERSTDQTNRFYSVAGIARNKYLEKPIYVLVNGATGSGAEVFAYGLQSAKRATVIGEKTLGGAHGFSTVKLSFQDHGDLIIGLPDSRMIDPNTNTNFEGVGVIPDIKTSADKALLQAQLEILTGIAKDASPEQGAALESLIAKIKYEMEKDPNAGKNLQEYVGKYGVRTISESNGVLMMQREGGPKLPLEAIGKDEFFIDVPLTPKPKIRFGRENGQVVSFYLIQGENETLNKKDN